MTLHKVVRGLQVGINEDLLNRPGAWVFEATEQGIFYMCPCGCGQQGFLGFRGKVTNPERPSWIWDGNRSEPTLEPSIRRPMGCKWHGHFVKGSWEPCADSGYWGS